MTIQKADVDRVARALAKSCTDSAENDWAYVDMARIAVAALRAPEAAPSMPLSNAVREKRWGYQLDNLISLAGSNELLNYQEKDGPPSAVRKQTIARLEALRAGLLVALSPAPEAGEAEPVAWNDAVDECETAVENVLDVCRADGERAFSAIMQRVRDAFCLVRKKKKGRCACLGRRRSRKRGCGEGGVRANHKYGRDEAGMRLHNLRNATNCVRRPLHRASSRGRRRAGGVEGGDCADHPSTDVDRIRSSLGGYSRHCQSRHHPRPLAAAPQRIGRRRTGCKHPSAHKDN